MGVAPAVGMERKKNQEKQKSDVEVTSWIIKVGVGLIRAWFGLVGKEGRKLRQKQFEKLRPQSAAVHSVFLSQLHSCRIDNTASIYPWPLLYFTIQCMFIWHICYKSIYSAYESAIHFRISSSLFLVERKKKLKYFFAGWE